MTKKKTYDVGYGKPPEATQFKKGQSGNPKGRPRGTRNLKTDVVAVLKKPVPISEGGRKRHISTQEAALMRLRDKALKGDARALDRLLALAATYTNDYSAAVVAHIKKDQIFIMDVVRGRWLFPELKRQITQLAQKHQADTLLIERAGPGLQMIPTLMEKRDVGVPTPIGITPKDDKTTRLEGASVMVERGDVVLPQEAPWKGDFLNELLAFPNGRHDDQVDAFSQLLNWHRKRHRGGRVALGGVRAIPLRY